MQGLLEKYTRMRTLFSKAMNANILQEHDAQRKNKLLYIKHNRKKLPCLPWIYQHLLNSEDRNVLVHFIWLYEHFSGSEYRKVCVLFIWLYKQLFGSGDAEYWSFIYGSICIYSVPKIARYWSYLYSLISIYSVPEIAGYWSFFYGSRCIYTVPKKGIY